MVCFASYITLLLLSTLRYSFPFGSCQLWLQELMIKLKLKDFSFWYMSFPYMVLSFVPMINHGYVKLLVGISLSQTIVAIKFPFGDDKILSERSGKVYLACLLNPRIWPSLLPILWWLLRYVVVNDFYHHDLGGLVWLPHCSNCWTPSWA